MEAINATIDLIQKAEHIIILCHYDPDGDAIGTMLGLSWALRGMGKQTTCACDDGAPWPFDFLPGSEEVLTDLADTAGDLVAVVDCSDTRRPGKVYEQAAAMNIPIVNIDHHKTNTNFGVVNLVQPQTVAAAEVTFNLLKAMEYDIDEKTAACLLTGLVTDTRCFKTPNVNQRVFRAAIELMDAGAPLAQITQMVMDRKKFHALAMLGKALQGVHHEDGVTWSAMPLEAWKNANGDPTSAAPRNFSSMLNTIEGTGIGVFFTETESRHVDISMRSKPHIDLTALFDEGAALHKQGGGHAQASGAEVGGPLEDVIARLLPELKALVKQQGLVSQE